MGNTIAVDLTATDTILGQTLSHDFKETLTLPGLDFQQSAGVISGDISESGGVATISVMVFGITVWHDTFSGVGKYDVDIAVGTGSIVGSVTIS